MPKQAPLPIEVIECFGSMGLRLCSRCREYRPIEIFYIRPSDGRKDAYCRPCRTIKRQEWRRANPEKVKEQKRASARRNPETAKKWQADNPEKMAIYAGTFKAKNFDSDRHVYYRHGITQEQTQLIFDFQDHSCAICGTPITIGAGGSRKTDHSHTTGFVRGLLCGKCNAGLGWYETRSERINEYIQNPPAQQLGLEIITDRRREDPSYGG